MPPLFSIVTVCLNAGTGLRRTVESVLSQQCGDFELLIKDGGSTDGSIDDLPRDARIRIIRSPDQGIFDAMNHALDFVTGSFVHFLNAADLFLDDTVLRDVAAEIRRSEDTEFFYGDVICLGFNREFVRYPEHLSRYFLYTHMLCHQGWFVARATYLRLGKFKTESKIGGDQVFLYDAILGARIRYRHVARFTVRYDVRGISSNVAVQQHSKAFRNNARRKYYPGWERNLYAVLWGIRMAVRDVLTLPPLLRMFRWTQRQLHGGLEH